MKLTDNDKRVLEAVNRAMGEYDGFGPHGSRDWTAIYRLQNAGLVRFLDYGECGCDCKEPKQRPIYVLTDEGKKTLE